MNMKAWTRHAAAAAYVLSVTYMIGKWVIHSASLKRGYFAIGGEYLFIPMVAWAASKGINLFLDALEEFSGRKSERTHCAIWKKSTRSKTRAPKESTIL